MHSPGNVTWRLRRALFPGGERGGARLAIIPIDARPRLMVESGAD